MSNLARLLTFVCVPVSLILQTVEPPMEHGMISFASDPLCLYPTYIMAEDYLASGQATEAATEFHKIIDHARMIRKHS